MRLLTHWVGEVGGEIESEIVSTLAVQLEKTIVFKGSNVIIADPDGKKNVLAGGSGYLRKAGCGSILAGMMVGLCATGVSPYEAAIASAWCFIRAGECALQNVGSLPAVLASDILDALPDVLRGVG